MTSRASSSTTAGSPPPRRVGTALVLAGLVLAGFGLAAIPAGLALGWMRGSAAKDLPEPPAAGPAPMGTNGLTADERQQYYHLSEGGELYPLAWLLALEQAEAGPGGESRYRPFLDNIERFGMIPDPPGPYNPYGLPVGVTVGHERTTGQQMVGLNCSACHVTELHFGGRAVRIDGGPSMAFINRFVRAIVDETAATAASAERRRRFLDRWRRVRLVPLPHFPVARGAAPASDDEPSETLHAGRAGAVDRAVMELRLLWSSRSHVEDALNRLNALRLVSTMQKVGTPDGFGRTDAFGAVRNQLFGPYRDAVFSSGGNLLPMDAPVSFPHLWGMRETAWFQWGANTNSVIERNVGQALGVGASFDPATFSSSVRLDHLHAMETLQYRLTPPAWPEALFGPVERAKAERGKALFDRTCALCHETYGRTGELNDYQLFPLDVSGTDPLAALNFEVPVMTAHGPTSMAAASADLIGKVVAAYYREHGTPPEVQAEWEARAVRPRPVIRSPLTDFAEYRDTRNRGVYRAKTLKGIWATAPFLHNGSVPTIYDLLLPAAQRPRRFMIGTKEFDGMKLGFVTDGPRFLTPPGLEPFVLDTRLPGNWNTGHEWWFYKDLTDEDRYAIIEFLKTFTEPGDYRFETPAALIPENVRAVVPLPIKAH